MVTVPPEVDVTLKQPISVCPIPLMLQLRRCYDAAEVRPRCQDAAFTPTAGSAEQNSPPPPQAGWRHYWRLFHLLPSTLRLFGNSEEPESPPPDDPGVELCQR